MCEGIDQLDNNEEECRNSLPQKVETFYEKESSTSLVYIQADELCENQSTDLAFDSSSWKGGALLYLEKAHAYLQNIKMVGMFTCSDDESLAVPDEESWALPDEEGLAPLKLENDAKKGMCYFTCFHSFVFWNLLCFLYPVYP